MPAKDLSVQARIRWLTSKLIAKFVNDASMGSAAISEAVIVGPFLCQEDYHSLLSCLIERFNLAILLKVNLLQGLVQLVQCAPTDYLTDDDLVRILACLRECLESVHTPSREYVYQLVFAVSKILEVMVTREVKGQHRERDHQPLLTVLRGLKGVEDDMLLKFQVDYAYQLLLHLPDDETSWQAFLRYTQSVAVGVSGVASVFKLDPRNALDAVEHFQQVAGNMIDVVKFGIDGARAFQEATQGASQGAERMYWSNKKEAWFLTLQAARIIVREGRLIEFNTLVCESLCRSEVNFQRGICLILGEIVVGQLWDHASRLSAIDFLGELYKMERGRKNDVKIRKLIASILSHISKMSWPDDIVDVEYDLDCMKFQRLEDPLFPIFIPLHAKANSSDLGDESFPLMKRVKDFLESDRRVFLLLGDSGSGKSMFCRQLERELWEKYEAGRRIPLYINLPSIHQPENNLIKEHLCDRKYISARKAQEIMQHRQLVLICDGYDESRLTTNLYTNNQLSDKQVKMVISCRNTFLRRGYEGRFLPYGANKVHDTSSNQFEEATILPFTDTDIHDFITQFVTDPTAATFLGNIAVESRDSYLEKLSTFPNVKELAKNPFLLTLTLKALPSLSFDVLNYSDLGVIQQNLYDGFIQEWVQISRKQFDTARFSDEDRRTFRDLLEADFLWCVMDYCKRLVEAIYLQQKGKPVVKYNNLKEKATWKAEFFGDDTKVTLLREASPLTREGIRYWFIHQSLLEFFASLAIYDPDDSSDDDSDDDGGEGDNGGGSGGSDGNTFYGSGSNGLRDDGGGKPAHRFGSSSGGNNDSSGRSGGSSSGGGGPSGRGNASSDDNHDSLGGSGSSPNESGSAGGGKDGSNGDEDDPQRRKEDFRSKKKARMNKSKASVSSGLMSNLNLFKEPAVLCFLVVRARTNPRFKKLLLLTIEESKSSVGPSLAAANAITILVKSGERPLEVLLDGIQVPYNYMLEECSESPEQSGCLTGLELVSALSAIETPSSPQMPNPDHQPTPHSLLKSLHSADTKACASHLSSTQPITAETATNALPAAPDNVSSAFIFDQPSSLEASALRYNIFLADASKPMVESPAPIHPQAQMESTLQLVFCARLLLENHHVLRSRRSPARVSVLDDARRHWFDAIQEDPPAQDRIRWLISRLVAEFLKDPSPGPEAIFEGMIQLLQSVPSEFLSGDDLVRIVSSIRKNLESTHAPDRAHVYHLVFAVSKVLEVMVREEVKGLDRQRDHQSLLATLRNLKGVDDDEFLKFQVNYAYQMLLYLPDGETSFQAFWRYSESAAGAISAVSDVFKLDPMSALAAVEHIQQVAGNAIDVVKVDIDGVGAFQSTAERATQATGKAHWSQKKQPWFLALQAGRLFVQDGRLVDFNTLERH
ncbi:hypothetical protein EC991_008249 [Linnemannia zychae]|nr:hypothetical protein EC991_008249 [Linnemannia zychae]